MAKILVVDDSALVRMKCSKVLTNNGYSVIEAENGQEALEKYKEFKPDGVLMDIVMPRMHGITALHEIRRIDPVAKIAMLTAMGQKAMVTSALKEGASDFVVKPFREGRVLDTVKRLLSKTKID
ncbi:MAG: response regulator [Dehalococcoidales bacterium]|nr:response regulator [Dehalococcoidales bacterium]